MSKRFRSGWTILRSIRRSRRRLGWNWIRSIITISSNSISMPKTKRRNLRFKNKRVMEGMEAIKAMKTTLKMRKEMTEMMTTRSQMKVTTRN